MDPRAFLDGITRMSSLYAPQVTNACQNLLSSHDTPRFRTLAGGDVRRLRLASLFQMTMPGAPSIYYGDEIGLCGGHDPGCRGAFPWQAPDEWDRDLLETMRALTGLRKAHPALRYGTWRLLWAEEESFAFERAHAGERIVVLINRRGAPARIQFTFAAREATRLWGEGRAEVRGRSLVIEGARPWSGLILRCSGELVGL